MSNAFALIADAPIDGDLGRDAEKTSKTVKFAKKEHRAANRHEKYFSYLNYFHYYPPKSVTEFLSTETTKHYESWYRDEAYKLHRELHPEAPLSRDAFFSSKGSTLL